MMILLMLSCSAVFSDTLTVAVYDFPPCVIIDKQGPSGFDVDVFNIIAKKAGLSVNYVYADEFTDLINGVASNKYDAAISGITITGERENLADFTHPYINSGLSILVNKTSKLNFLKTIYRYVFEFGPMFILITIFTAFFGIVLFFIEKIFAKKESMFTPDKPVTGMFNGYWFGNVASTTMGFGDFIPKSVPGKLITILMAYIGIYFILPYATANMNMAMQQENEIYAISKPEDLIDKVVATEENTTSEMFLRKLGCNIKTVKHIDEAYTLLEKKKVDAVVFDMPTLKYLIKDKGKNFKFKISGSMFDLQSYGFALCKNSSYRKILNENLVDFMRTSEYWELHNKWFDDK